MGLMTRIGGGLAAVLALSSVLQAQPYREGRGPALETFQGPVQSPILTIESERLYTESAFGRRIAQEIEADSAVLAAENRRIEAELTQEEQDLTERRAEMAPEAFRTLADAFDAKVEGIRNSQDAKARALGQRQEAAQIAFVQAAQPVLENLMRSARAAVILERNTVVLSANAADITDRAIAQIDAAIGDGAHLESDAEQ